MPATLELPDDSAEKLTAEAGRLGLSLPDYAARLLESAPRPAPRTGAELVEWWRAEGVIGTRPDIPDAAGEARELREQAERRGPRG